MCVRRKIRNHAHFVSQVALEKFRSPITCSKNPLKSRLTVEASGGARPFSAGGEVLAGAAESEAAGAGATVLARTTEAPAEAPRPRTGAAPELGVKSPADPNAAGAATAGAAATKAGVRRASEIIALSLAAMGVDRGVGVERSGGAAAPGRTGPELGGEDPSDPRAAGTAGSATIVAAGGVGSSSSGSESEA